jgi:hypothetical protein
LGAGITAIGQLYNDTQCKDFAKEFQVAQQCAQADLNGAPAYSDTICYQTSTPPSKPVGYFYTNSYAGLNCEGSIVNTFGYAAGVCLSYGKGKSVIFNCAGK